MSERRRFSAAQFARVLGLVLVLGALACLACANQPMPARWDGPDGLVLEWSPAQPRFGDLVKLSASWPAKQVTNIGGLFDPKQQQVGGSLSAWAGENQIRTWIVRVNQIGNWSWGKAGHLLWTIKSEAGQGTELKSFDAQGLWEGRVVPLAPPTAAPATRGQP